MSGAIPIQKSFTFAGAGQQPYQAIGRYLLVKEAGGTVYLEIEGGSEIQVKKGGTYDLGRNVNNMRVRSTIAQTVLFMLSENPQFENGDIEATVTATVEGADTINTPVDVTCTATAGLLIAGNTDRKEVEIGVKDDEPNGIRVGGSGVTATRGSYIAPGTSKFFANTAALYGIRDGSSDVDAYIFEQSKA